MVPNGAYFYFSGGTNILRASTQEELETAKKSTRTEVAREIGGTVEG